jgi:hypothetical protein
MNTQAQTSIEHFLVAAPHDRWNAIIFDNILPDAFISGEQQKDATARC